MYISEKHFSITSAQDVNQIASPLKKLGISYFNHVRIYSDGSLTLLANQAQWSKYFAKREMSGSLSLLDLKPGIYLWQDVINPQIIEEARNFFNLDNLVNFVYSGQNYIDIFAFGTPVTRRSMLSFYFNNLDLLQLFIEYFKKQSIILFNQADKNRVLMPDHMIKRTNHGLNGDVNEDLRADLLLSINAIEKQYHLTKKELFCLKHLAHGKSAKEIARTFDNSPRTIEKHIANIKNKTGCFSKAQILDVYFKQFPISHYFNVPSGG